MPTARCPICHREAPPRPANPSFPFCSTRCRAVDLGRWLGEEYRVPTRGADEEEDEQPRDAPREDSWGDA
jgi:endogenous inhibitor of DNA gyrase (YacG/DUF329 family)